jgi:hypothetical protein
MAIEDETREHVAARLGERVPVGIDRADEHETIYELIQVAWAHGASAVVPDAR